MPVECEICVGCQAVHNSTFFREMFCSATHFIFLHIWFDCNQFRVYRCSVKILAVHGWTRMALNKSKVIIHMAFYSVKNWILGIRHSSSNDFSKHTNCSCLHWFIQFIFCFYFLLCSEYAFCRSVFSAHVEHYYLIRYRAVPVSWT